MLLCCYYEAITVSWVFLSSTLLVSFGTYVLFVEWSDGQMVRCSDGQVVKWSDGQMNNNIINNIINIIFNRKRNYNRNHKIIFLNIKKKIII